MNLKTIRNRKPSRAFCAFLACMLVLLLLPAGGCAKDDWEGEWNRTGDSTFTRSELTITNAGGSSFDFSFVLYNGGIVGQVTDLSAVYDDSSKQSARCNIPDTRAYIDFAMDEYGGMNVVYGYDVYNESTIGIIESEIFGFTDTAYLTGHYERGDVEYINQTLYSAGILTLEEDERVRNLMPDNVYMRLTECFQTWKISNGEENTAAKNYDPHDKKGKHEDEIGAYVYYGSNSMQNYAAIIIIYDDGTASVVVSMVDSAPIYYSSNAIYKDGSLTPLPVQTWLKNYNAEQEAIAAAQQPQTTTP